MDFLSELVNLVGLSAVTALITGISMGVYLAAVNDFIPVARVRKSLITNVVIAFSFFAPIAMERAFLDEPTLETVAWMALGVLWLTFSTTADVTNWLLCTHRYRIRK